MASPALAGPTNSVIGGKKLQRDMVHSAGVGYPAVLYEWWNKGKGNLDWGLAGELVYGDWPAANSGSRGFGRSGRFIKIGLGIDGMMRWHLATRKHDKVTSHIAILGKPGILIAGNRGDSFTFGIMGEALVPVSIDVHERVNVVVGGAFIIRGYINSSGSNFGQIPLLIRMGVEIDAAENVEPWFFFDLGPGINIGSAVSGAEFAWRLGAGTTFWGIMGNNSKNKSDAAGGGQSGGEEVVVEETVVE